MAIKTIHTTKKRIIVKFTNESSSNEILINGNAKAQTTTVSNIININCHFDRLIDVVLVLFSFILAADNMQDV